METGMGTEIKTWQVVDGRLKLVQTSLKNEARNEPYDLEPWIASQPDIVSTDLLIVGRQVQTRSGPIDLLGIDSSGNTVIIELKRDELPRECLAQAIDYASDVATWTVDRLGEVCTAYLKKPLGLAFGEAFPDADIENLSINSTQRIVLVGFAIESALERMIEWLSDTYAVNVNAVVLSYARTSSGDEILTRTSIISEEVEQERTRKQKKFQIPKSDDPGTHDLPQLKDLLRDYLSRAKVTNQRMRDILFPALLSSTVVTRAALEKAFVAFDPQYDESKVGFYLSSVSSQLGLKKNDFLRQVVAYEYPRHHWEKDNFSIRDQYRTLVQEVLAGLDKRSSSRPAS
jgi:hypothetical protein